MLNSEVIETIAKNANISSNDVLLVLDALADLLKETVHDKGEAASVAGLGTFKKGKGLQQELIILLPLFKDK